jgi:hypothetical protein
MASAIKINKGETPADKDTSKGKFITSQVYCTTVILEANLCTQNWATQGCQKTEKQNLIKCTN